MRIRSGSYAQGDGSADGQPPGVLRWRVARQLTVVKGAGALVLLVGLLLSLDNPVRLLVTAVGAGILAGHAVRDLIAPVRLEVDPSGITVVTGFASRHRVAWASVERIRIDERRRLGTRSRLLEIDIGETIYLLGEYDLGGPVEEAATALRRAQLASRVGPDPADRSDPAVPADRPDPADLA